MFKKLAKLSIPVALLAMVSLAGCGTTTAPTHPATAQPSTSSTQGGQPIQGEKALPPEKNPVGDIPDSQAFIRYSSAVGGYSLEVPEGWARTEQGTEASFINKFNGVRVTIGATSAQPDAQSIQTNQVATLIKTGRAVQVANVKNINLPGGHAVLVSFSSNSDPNSVTGKQIRLENSSYYFYKNGKLATVTVWAPLGSDNVDQWKRISESFRWN
ncbi:MAG: hypothetical protein ACYCVD_06725 [Desulfitobacteriaceae bacterium]